MAVAVGKQFIGALASSVQRHRLIDRIVDAEREFAVGAIHRTARRIDQVHRPVVPAGFEHVQESHQIRLRIHIRVIQRITNPRLRRQMHDLGELIVFE